MLPSALGLRSHLAWARGKPSSVLFISSSYGQKKQISRQLLVSPAPAFVCDTCGDKLISNSCSRREEAAWGKKLGLRDLKKKKKTGFCLKLIPGIRFRKVFLEHKWELGGALHGSCLPAPDAGRSSSGSGSHGCICQDPRSKNIPDWMCVGGEFGAFDSHPQPYSPHLRSDLQKSPMYLERREQPVTARGLEQQTSTAEAPWHQTGLKRRERGLQRVKVGLERI